MIAEIVRQLESMGETERPSSTIGELMMKRLKQRDDVAYVRYASVYRDFRETQDFTRFLDEEGLSGGRAVGGSETRQGDGLENCPPFSLSHFRGPLHLIIP